MGILNEMAAQMDDFPRKSKNVHLGRKLKRLNSLRRQRDLILSKIRPQEEERGAFGLFRGLTKEVRLRLTVVRIVRNVSFY